MTKTTEKLQDKLFTTLPISPSTPGKRLPKRERTSARVSFLFILNAKGLLEKNRHKRPTLEEVLNHPWFSEFKDIHAMRLSNANVKESRFAAYTLTEPNSPKIREEIDKYSK